MKNKILLHDYLNKFPEDNPYSSSKQSRHVYPKLNKIIVTSTYDHKYLKRESFLSHGASGSSSAAGSELYKLYILFSRIFHQVPKIIKAQKSVASFNLRKGMNMGVFLSVPAQSPASLGGVDNPFFISLLPLLNELDSKSPGMFGIRGVNIFNVHFSSSHSEETTDYNRSEQVSQYAELINDLKNSSEFIGCNINLHCLYPSSNYTPSRKLFILRYNQIPVYL